MKRLLLVSTLLALSAGTVVASAQERASYFVATRGPASALLGRAPIRASQIGLDEFVPATEHLEAEFRTVDGFAARLTPSEAAELRQSPWVQSVERAGDVVALEDHGQGVFSGASSQQVVPWGVGRVRASEIWSRTRGRAVRVGVIDTGIDYLHPDLSGVYAGGYDFVNEDPDPMDDRGHGTHVAGTIAAMDNDLGVVGVAPEVELYALKVLDGSGSGSSVNVIRAVEWAIEHDLDVINLSLGGRTRTDYEATVYQKAKDHDLIVVAAAGNGFPEVPNLDYPAAYEGVISVSAIDQFDRIAGFSQRGGNLDFSAPGVGVESTYIFPLTLFTEQGTAIQSRVMEYASTTPVAGELIPCGLGRPEDFPDEVVGQIAFIERGELTFADKVRNATAAGAIGVVVYNHTAAGEENGGVVNGTLGEPGEWITVVGISRESGLLLIGLDYPAVSMATKSDYASLNGTSMATPHVAGVFALLRGLAPALTSDELYEIARRGARDLGLPGRDLDYGHGFIDAAGAASALDSEEEGTDEELTPRRRGFSRGR